MKLIDRLKKLSSAGRERIDKTEPYKHKQETADELYDLVVLSCENRANGGCSTLSFHWDYVFTNDRDLWNEQHAICLEVVDRLKEQGLKATCNSEFTEPYFESWCQEWIRPDSHHYIEVGWNNGWFPYEGKV